MSDIAYVEYIYIFYSWNYIEVLYFVNYVVIIIGLLSWIGDAIFLILSLCIKHLVPHEVYILYILVLSLVLLCNPYIIALLIINKIFILLVNN